MIDQRCENKSCKLTEPKNNNRLQSRQTNVSTFRSLSHERAQARDVCVHKVTVMMCNIHIYNKIVILFGIATAVLTGHE